MKTHMIELCGACMGPLTTRRGDGWCELCDTARFGNAVYRVQRGSRKHLSSVLVDMRRHGLIDEQTVRELTRRLDYA